MAAALPIQPLTDDERRMVEANLGLIDHMLNKLNVRPSEREDRWQDGCLGLMRAAQKYDPTIAAFSTYACKWILAGITRGCENELGVSYRSARRDGRRYVRPIARDPFTITYIPAVEPTQSTRDELHELGLSDEGIALMTMPKTTLKKHYGMISRANPKIDRIRRHMLRTLRRNARA